jgi:hypothetical protein
VDCVDCCESSEAGKLSQDTCFVVDAVALEWIAVEVERIVVEPQDLSLSSFSV